MDWKTFQNPTFQILYSSISCNDRPPPLQIRSFTSDCYEAIKERERKNNSRREQNKAEQCSCAWKEEDTDASANAAVMLELIGMGSEPQAVMSATNSGCSKTEPLVIRDNGSAHKDYELSSTD